MIGPKKSTTSPRSIQRVANCFEPMKSTEKQKTLDSSAIEKWSRVNTMQKDMPAKGPRKRPDRECKPHFHQWLSYETNKLFHKLTCHIMQLSRLQLSQLATSPSALCHLLSCHADSSGEHRNMSVDQVASPVSIHTVYFSISCPSVSYQGMAPCGSVQAIGSKLGSYKS